MDQKARLLPLPHPTPAQSSGEAACSTYHSVGDRVHFRGRLGFLHFGDGFTELWPGAAEKAWIPQVRYRAVRPWRWRLTGCWISLLFGGLLVKAAICFIFLCVCDTREQVRCAGHQCQWLEILGRRKPNIEPMGTKLCPLLDYLHPRVGAKEIRRRGKQSESVSLSRGS